LRRTDPWCWHAIIIPGLVGLRVLALKLEFRTKRIAPAAAGKKSPHDYIGAADAVSNQHDRFSALMIQKIRFRSVTIFASFALFD
jgi:hypothetical protein